MENNKIEKLFTDYEKAFNEGTGVDEESVITVLFPGFSLFMGQGRDATQIR